MYINFEKEVFCEAAKECMTRLGISRKELATLLGVHVKTIGLYLNKNTNDVPKISQIIVLHQYLQTSLSNLLLGRGPKFIDPKTSKYLDDLMNLYSNPKEPAYFMINVLLMELDYSVVEQIGEHVEIFIKHNYQKK